MFYTCNAAYIIYKKYIKLFIFILYMVDWCKYLRDHDEVQI
jgi:hypothetical protein